MEPCPHCGFVNKPNAIRCECCLAEFTAESVERPVTPMPASAPAQPRPEALPGEPPSVRSVPSALSPRSAPPALSREPRAAPSPDLFPQQEPATDTIGEPPPISPDIRSGGAKVIVALIVVGLLGGVWLIRPVRGQPSLISRLFSAVKRAPVSRPQAAPTAQPGPAVVDSGGPASHAAPAQPGPAAAPAARQPAGPHGAAPVPADKGARGTQPVSAPAARSRDSEVAEAQYEIALNLLRRKQMAPARAALEQIVQKYPDTDAAAQARDLLKQIPAPTEVAHVSPPPAPARPAPVPRAERPAAQAPPPPPEETSGGKRVITTEDLAARKSPVTEARKAPSIPASLQAAQVPAPQSAATSVRDDVRLASATREQGQLVLMVDYVLASPHTRQVFLGAWMRDESVSRRLSYTATPMKAGRGSARVVLPGIPPNVTSLRVVFFEENGALFFTKDFTIP